MVLEAICISLAAANESNEAEDEVAYTNAYNDLFANQSFNPEDYPELSSSDPGYYSLEVITIAESVNGELFVYVYQPSADPEKVTASYITISRELIPEVNSSETLENPEGGFKVYGLDYVNHYNQFFKYKVKDLNVGTDELRIYEITDILRPFNKNYGDKEAEANNTVSAVPYPVGRRFTFIGKPGSSGNSSMSVEDIEYITITDKYVGYMRFQQDMPILAFMSGSAQDAHFVAFSTDKPIEKLLEADVYYTVQNFYYDNQNVTANDPDELWGEKQEMYSYLDYQDKAIYEVSDGSVLSSSSLIVDRIQETSDFLSLQAPIFSFPGFSVDGNVPFTDEALQALAKTKWVLCFKETSYTNTTVGSNTIRSFARVGDVKILRLKFETEGKIYDLGVVDNMQTGSPDPSATIEQQDWWQKIMMLLMLILLAWVLTFLQGPLGLFFRIIWKGIKAIFKFALWILSRPWAIIRWLLGFLDKKRKPKSKDKPKGG